jgi:hypothetical protein
MIITAANGHACELMSIGLIRFKVLSDGTIEAEISPAGPDYQFEDGATLVEIIINQDEADRILRVAPHLVASPGRGWPEKPLKQRW